MILDPERTSKITFIINTPLEILSGTRALFCTWFCKALDCRIISVPKHGTIPSLQETQRYPESMNRLVT